MSSLNVKKTRTFNKTTPSASKNVNPYANLKAVDYNDQSHLALPSIEEKDKAKMGKAMQRRMSVNQTVDISKLIPTGSDAPALPTGLLEQYQQQQQSAPIHQVQPQQAHTQQHRQVSNQRPSSKGLDLHDQSVLKLLQDPEFNPELFISTRLSDSTASDIEKFSSNLVSLNHKVQNDIKSTSNQTYQRLLRTSKELSSTDTELKFLRNAINELLDITNTMKETAEKKIAIELELTSDLTKSTTVKRKQRQVDRSSILVLEKMWNTEMNSLFKHVEGAQKFIAAIPGRHIIVESGRWYELNAATFKTLQPAHIFLLNDLILIATRRRKTQKKQIDSKSSQALVADQCWPLREVSLTELKPNTTNGETYAINITYNSLSYIYQTDRYDHYQKIINGYKKARDELRDISEAENIKQKQLRDSMSLLTISESNGNSGSSKQHKRQSLHPMKSSNSLLQDLSSKIHSKSRSMDNSSSLRNLKKIDDRVDEVELLIFQENFGTSIRELKALEDELKQLKEKCNLEESLYHNVVSLKISNKFNEILKKLINSFTSITLTQSEIITIIETLISLGQLDVAKTLFLSNRSTYIKKLIDDVFEARDLDGRPKIYQYLIEISIVKFQNLKQTIALYKHIFTKHDIKSLSYLVNWGLKEVESHVESLKKILNNVKLTRVQLEKSILILHRQTNELKDVGLDVEYLLQGFYKSINVE